MKYIFITLIFILSAVQVIKSQEITQKINGTVKDNITGESLPGANIIIIGSSPVIGTISSEDGKFVLQNVPIGIVSLRISYVGYKSVEVMNRDLRSGKALNINIFMEEMVVYGDEVEIKAGVDKRGSINTMTSVSSRTFSIDETRRYAGSRGDVARMAANYAGVQVASDGRNDIVVRGNSPSSLQWRLEGIEVPNPNHYGAFGTTGGPVSILNNNQLDNSDFLTGAFPAEYGNALSGVFDLRLKNGNSDNYEFMTMVGFNGFELGAEGPFSKKSDASFIGNFRYSTMEIFDLLGMDFGTGAAVPEYQDFSLKINLPTKKSGTFSLWGIGGKSHINMLDSERDTNDVDFYGGEGWDINNGSSMAVFGLNHSIMLGKSAFIKSTLAFTHHEYYVTQDSIVPDTKDIIPYYNSDFRENRVEFNSYLRKRLNVHHNFQLGINVNHYISNLQDSIYMPSQMIFNTLTNYKGTSNLIRVYLEWQYKVNNRLTFNAGFDYMYYAFNKTTNPEPRFGVSYAVTANSKLNFGYGLHSQILGPNVYNRETYLGNGMYQSMNTDLALIKSHHFVLAYDWNITELIRLKAETYYQMVFDAAINASEKDAYSILNQGADFYLWTPDTLKSTGTGRNYGMELTLEHFLKNGFYFLATGSLFESKYKASDGIVRNTAYNSNFVTNLLAGKEWDLHKNSSNLKLKSVSRRLGADIKLNWTGGRRYTPINVEQSKIEHRPVYVEDQTYTYKFPNYFRTDLKVFFKYGGKKTNYEMGIDVQNIFNNQNIFSQSFNSSTGELYYTYQLGVMIIPYFRFEF